jgi:hypothetical protein
MKRYLIMSALAVAGSLAFAEDQGGRWALSAGAGVRQAKSDFTFSPVGRDGWASIYKDPANKGTVGIFRTGGDPVVYADGTVGIFDFHDGTARFMVDSPSQVGVDPNARSRFNSYPRDVSFHSYSYANNITDGELAGSDDQMGVSPYVALRFAALQKEKGCLNIVGQYAFSQSSMGTTREIGTLTAGRTTWTTRYDVDEVYIGGSPFLDPTKSTDGVVYDASRYVALLPPLLQASEYAQAPHTSSGSDVLRRYSAVARADLDTTLHEIMLAAEWMMPIGKRVSVGAFAGPTLNLVNYQYDCTTTFTETGSGQVVSSQKSSDSGTKAKAGVAAGVKVNASLDKNDRFFVEGDVSYRWVDSLNVGDGAADVDLSSLAGSLGIGVRL